MANLFAAGFYIGLALIVVGSWIENFTLQRMRRDGWQVNRSWRNWFTASKEVIRRHRQVAGDSNWIRWYRIASIGTITGLVVIFASVATLCVALSKFEVR
jgi:hypothetical protein